MKIDLQRLNTLLASGTPGPWAAPTAGQREWLYEDCVLVVGTAIGNGDGRVIAKMNTNFPYRDDLELIAAAVSALPILLEVAEAAKRWAKFGRDDDDDEHELLLAVRKMMGAT